jgi:hypothetical protein
VDYSGHRSSATAWDIAECIDEAVLEDLRARVKGAHFFSVSLDESTAVDVTSWMAVHMHVVHDWEREPLYIKVGVRVERAGGGFVRIIR